MKYFNKYSVFEANSTQSPIKKILSYTFKGNFFYNKINVKKDNDIYAEKLQEVKDELSKWIKDNNNPPIEEIQLNSRGFASFVPTAYASKKIGKSWKDENNIELSKDRANAITEDVIVELTKHLESEKYTDVKFKINNVEGNISSKKSNTILDDFLSKHYENDKTKLIDAMIEDYKNRNKGNSSGAYVMIKDDKGNPKKFNLTYDNADKVYFAILDSPYYVRYTSRLKVNDDDIRQYYRNEAQYSEVEIIINPNADETIVEEPTPKKKIEFHPLPKLKSITFEKDNNIMDANGREAYELLRRFLKVFEESDYYAQSLVNIVFVGHAEADDEFDRKIFNAGKDYNNYFSKGNAKTIFTEHELADVRTILSLTRSKIVTRKVYNESAFTKNMHDKGKIWHFPLGTVYGDKLENQKCVQIIVIFNPTFVEKYNIELEKYNEDNNKKVSKIENNPINTEPQIKFGTSIEYSPVVKRCQKLLKNLGYNLRYFKRRFLTVKTSVNSDIPDYGKIVRSTKLYHDFKDSVNDTSTQGKKSIPKILPDSKVNTEKTKEVDDKFNKKTAKENEKMLSNKKKIAKFEKTPKQ